MTTMMIGSYDDVDGNDVAVMALGEVNGLRWQLALISFDEASSLASEDTTS